MSLAPLPVFALDPNRALSQYVHDVWTEVEDLPLGSVTGVAQTKDGYVWLATQEGLARFDGVRFEVFNPANTPAMRKASLVALVQDRQGALWMTLSGGGVLRKQGDEWTAFGSDSGLANDSAETLMVDERGRIWVGTSRGVSVFEGGKFSRNWLPLEIRDHRAEPLFEDRQGYFWFGSRKGLYRWREGAPELYTTADGLPHNSVLSAYQDAQGRLWFGTRNGLAQWNDGRFAVHTIPGGRARQTINVIRGDRDGNLWLGTSGGGLLRFRDGRVDALDTEDGMSHVTNIFEDAENNLWIGTFGDGLHRLQNGKFIVYGVREGLSHEATYSAYEDTEGAVWISTYGGGLNRLKDGAVTAYTSADGLRNEAVNMVVGGRNGDVWLSTLSGLHRLSGGKFRAYTRDDGIEERLVMAILEDSTGRLWVGNDEGLHVLQGERFRVYKERDGLPSDSVLSLAEGRDGSLWIGTYDGGLVRLKDDHFTVYRDAKLDEQPVTCIYEDAQGTLWLGTFGGGLIRLHHGRFDTYTVQQGMFDDHVLNILEDDQGRLWMSSNRGIFRVDKSDFDAVARGAQPKVRTTVYGKDDGMRSAETNGGGLAAKHRDGRLWFPTQKGVVVIDTKRIEINARPPHVVIESMRTGDRDIAIRSPIELAPGTANLEIQYTGISFVGSKKIAFRYRLEGLENSWVDAGTRRVAYYTNLGPGEYRFKVIARNSDGLWNEKGETLTFSIRPRFYQTRWFLLLCATVMLLSTWALHRLRLALAMAKVAVYEERNRIAQEIHDGLTQELGGITMQLEAARERVETATGLEEAVESIGYVQRARTLVENALEEQHRLVWALHPVRLDDEDLAEAIGRLVVELDADSGTSFTCHISGTPLELPHDMKLAVLRIAQEALFNAARHGQASHIEARLDYEPAALRLTVKDDGRGFDTRPGAAKRRGHFGLNGMHRRVRRLGGTLEVISQIDEGTTIIALFPQRRWFFRILNTITGRIAPERRPV